MKATTELRPACLQWARDRAGYSVSELAARLAGSKDQAKIAAWEAKISNWEVSGQLTAANAERLAHVTHTPLGYLFLPEPPVEQLPIPDFRSAGGAPLRPTPDLLDVVYDALRRQDWYRDYQLAVGEERLSFVGSLKVSNNIDESAERIRGVVSWDSAFRAQIPTWEEALSKQIEKVEDIGVIVMRSGIVGNNTHRALSVSEFRGFALTDDYAPAIFINSVDAKSAQMFTLAHELVHIWLGQSGVFNLNRTYSAGGPTESFCNKVAAELLVPLADLKTRWAVEAAHADRVARLTRYFKVSPVVILRRLRDADYIDENAFDRLYADELAQARPKKKSKGGDFYNTVRARLGQRFIAALIESTLEGRTLYRDAFGLLGVSNAATLHELARKMGAMA